MDKSVFVGILRKINRGKMLKNLLIILSVYLSSVSAGEINNAESESYRLPNQTYPESYIIHLVFQSFDQDVMTFNGTVTIDVKILEDTETITLHSSVININEIRPVEEFSDVLLNYTLDTDREFLIIKRSDGEKFENNSKFTIRIGFSSRIEESPTHRGVYRGSYYDANSVKK